MIRRQPAAAVPSAPSPSPAAAVAVVPGLAEARAALTDLRAREADAAHRIQTALQDGREAEARRRRLVAAAARGDDVEPSAVAEAEADIAGAGERAALHQEALQTAIAATKAAERRVADVLRAELRRRVAPARAASEAALERSRAEAAECNRLAGLAVAAQQAASTSSAGVADLEQMLARTAEFASAPVEVAA